MVMKKPGEVSAIPALQIGAGYTLQDEAQFTAGFVCRMYGAASGIVPELQALPEIGPARVADWGKRPHIFDDSFHRVFVVIVPCRVNAKGWGVRSKLL